MTIMIGRLGRGYPTALVESLVKMVSDFSNILKALTLSRMAEGVGFEPTVRFHAHTLSKRAP
jgi:hypothetical protein